MHIEAQAAKCQPFPVERALLDNEDFKIFCLASEGAAQLSHVLKRLYGTIDASRLSSDAKRRAYVTALDAFWDFAARSLLTNNRCQ